MTTTELMDGSSVAGGVLEDARRRAEHLALASGRRPCLATVLIGDDPASTTYVRMKQNRCRDVGIVSRRVALAASTETAEAIEVDGILVQHPVPVVFSDSPAPGTTPQRAR